MNSSRADLPPFGVTTNLPERTNDTIKEYFAGLPVNFVIRGDTPRDGELGCLRDAVWMAVAVLSNVMDRYGIIYTGQPAVYDKICEIVRLKSSTCRFRESLEHRYDIFDMREREHCRDDGRMPGICFEFIRDYGSERKISILKVCEVASAMAPAVAPAVGQRITTDMMTVMLSCEAVKLRRDITDFDAPAPGITVTPAGRRRPISNKA